MRKLLKRWYGWLALCLLMGVATSTALIYSSRGRITQANFERIRYGMTEEEVTALLGEGDPLLREEWAEFWQMQSIRWNNGPSWIKVGFDKGRVDYKELCLATPGETLEWYGKKAWVRIKEVGNRVFDF